jgi:tRNA A37 threonylcarbamoyladenosine biosynthesis protein TsaE
MYEQPALVLVEWADKVEPALPESYLLVEIRVTGDSSREFKISAVGEELAEVPTALSRQLEEATES